jgi:hypothetical protein
VKAIALPATLGGHPATAVIWGWRAFQVASRFSLTHIDLSTVAGSNILKHPETFLEEVI